MSKTGLVKNGVVILDEGHALPEGARVRIELVGNGEASSLAQGLLQWAGQGVDLPEDLARNHDHYLHGQPKQ